MVNSFDDGLGFYCGDDTSGEAVEGVEFVLFFFHRFFLWRIGKYSMDINRSIGFFDETCTNHDTGW